VTTVQGLKSGVVAIHPTAIVAADTIIEPGVEIHAFAIVGPGVSLGEGTKVQPFAQIQGPTVIGRYNKIGSYSFIGCDSQDKKYQGGPSQLVIGDHNDIREYATLSRGSAPHNPVTQVGSHNLMMAHTHIAHDCIIGSHNTFANNASLAGHVVVGDYVGIGGFAGVHQFCRIGSHSFCGGGSLITKDVPPYMLVAGHPARLVGLNIEGLKRRSFSSQQIERLKALYKTIFRQSLVIHDTALEMLQSPDLTDDGKELLQFIISSARGIIR
jgi:UDP-N-acetylglucosamine acyltransferase